MKTPVLTELLQIFRAQGPGEGLREELDQMIRQSAELVELAGDVYFQRSRRHGEPRDIAAEDKKINKLQRQIRKEALLRAVASEDGFDLPFCLSLMNVVKDVERIGDYAKDVAKLAEKAPRADASAYDELALEAEKIGLRIAPILQESEQVKAVNLIEEGKDLRKRISAALSARVASDGPGAGQHVLCLQYYLRIVAHMMNVLTTIVTPLHRMDYTGKRSLLPEVKAKLDEASAK